MYRSLYTKLLEWKDSKHRKPLILEGARQVGKTWLLQEFGRNEYKNVAYLRPHSTKYVKRRGGGFAREFRDELREQ